MIFTPTGHTKIALMLVALMVPLAAQAQESAPQGPAGAGEANQPETLGVMVGEGADQVITNPLISQKDAPIRIKVHLSAQGIVREADAIGVECDLDTALVRFQGQPSTVAEGYAVFVRKGKTPTLFGHPSDGVVVGEFEGDSIEITAEIPLMPALQAPPLESWTSGGCAVALYRAGDIAWFTHVCDPRTDIAPVRAGNHSVDLFMTCLYPGFSPDATHVTFVRPGFESYPQGGPPE